MDEAQTDPTNVEGDDAEATTNSTSTNNNDNDGDKSQVRVSFITKNPDIRVTEAPILVPVKLGRLGLSQVINMLLGDGQQRPFDFLLANEFVRTSLNKHIKRKGLSEERVLNIEYIEALAPPQGENPCEHEDWVSCVAGGFSGFALTGSYDGKVRLWNQRTGQMIGIGEGHVASIKGVSYINKRLSSKGTFKFITCSMDKSIVSWRLPKSKKVAKMFYIYSGHTDTVESIDVSPDGRMFVSGSFDTTVRVWSTKPDTVPEGDRPSKKQKVVSTQAIYASAKVGSHSGAVQSVQWPTEYQAISGGWDYAVKIWDINQYSEQSKIRTPAVIYSVNYSPLHSLVLTSHADKTIRVWDPRTPDLVEKFGEFFSHKGFVSQVKWHPRTQIPQFVSSSHDGTVKYWDMRSSTPLFTLKTHTDKVLCVDWAGVSINDEAGGQAGEFDIVSGGADNVLRCFQFSKLAPETQTKIA